MNNQNYQQQFINPNTFVSVPKQGFDPMKAKVFGGLSAVMDDLEENQRHLPESMRSEGYDHSFIERRDSLRQAAINNKQQLRQQIRAEQQRNLEAIRRHEEQMRQQQQMQQMSQMPQQNYNYQNQGQYQQNSYMAPNNYNQFNNQNYQQQFVPNDIPMGLSPNFNNIQTYPVQNDNSVVTMEVFNRYMSLIVDEISNLSNLIKDLMTMNISETELWKTQDSMYEEVKKVDLEDEPEPEQELSPYLPGMEPTIDPEVASQELDSSEEVKSGIDENGKPVHRKVKTGKKIRLNIAKN